MVEPWVILLTLPIVVYFTRVFGILMSNFVAEDSPYRSTLVILPVCAMASFFIPRALEGSPGEQAVLVVFLVVFWLTNNSMISMVVGLGGLLALQFLT